MASKAKGDITDLLAKEILITWRSSDRVAKRLDVKLRYDLGLKSICLAEGFRFDEITRVPVRDIKSIKPKDYVQRHEVCFGIHVVAAGVQHCFLFPKIDDRDMWARQLAELVRTRTEGPRSRNASSEEPDGQAWSVQTVEVVCENQDNAFELKMTLFHSKKGTKVGVLPIRKNMSADTCRMVVSQFQKANELLPTEGSSMYRLVKALLARLHIKGHIQEWVHRIDSLHIDRFSQNPDALTEEQIAHFLDQAKSELGVLRQVLPKALAEGTGPRILSAILLHSIDKLELINETTAQLRKKLVPRRT